MRRPNDSTLFGFLSMIHNGKNQWDGFATFPKDSWKQDGYVFFSSIESSQSLSGLIDYQRMEEDRDYRPGSDRIRLNWLEKELKQADKKITIMSDILPPDYGRLNHISLETSEAGFGSLRVLLIDLMEAYK